MISNFTYRSDPVRIVFGAGAIAALRAEADFHKISRLLVLCSPTRTALARKLIAPVAERCLGFCETAGQTMPRDAFDRIVGDIKRADANGFIVIGGGSPIGLAKAAAATTGIPYIAVVTTYSGSEMAARWYIGVAENRIDGESVAALPATAIYDPELTLDLPPAVSASTPIRSCRAWPRKPCAFLARACRGSCRIRAISRPGRMRFTRPGSLGISAPRSA